MLFEWADDVNTLETSDDLLQNVHVLANASAVCSNELMIDVCDSLVTAEVLAKAIADSVTGLDACGTSRTSCAIDKVIHVCNQLARTQKVNKSDISCCLARENLNLPLETLIKLERSGLLTLEEYVGSGRRKDVDEHALDGLSHELHKMAKEEKDSSKEVVLDIVLSLSSLLKSERIHKKTIERISDVVFSLFEEQEFRYMFVNKDRKFLLSTLTDFKKYQKKVDIAFIVDLLSRFFLNGEKQTIEQAYRQHNNWVFKDLSKDSIDALQSFIVILDEKTLFTCVSSSLRNGSCNYQRLFSLISVWLVSTGDSVQNIMGISTQLLMDALEIQNHHLLKVSLLTARHCSLMQGSGFPSYEKWLRDALSDLETTFTSSRDALITYMKCLVDIVPFESRSFLSVHLSVSPQIPASAKYLLNEYTTVAKTMLRDLSAEEKSSVPINSAMLESAVNDVENGLQQFRLSGIIPKSIMEISVFRKAYFMTSFLPALLNPEAVENDKQRKAFIEQLRKAGKIPSRVYQNYRQAIEDRSIAEFFSLAGSDINEAFAMVTRKINEMQETVDNVLKIEEDKKQRVSLQFYLASLMTHITKFKELNDRCTEGNHRKASLLNQVIDVLLVNVCRTYCYCIGNGKTPVATIAFLYKPIVNALLENEDLAHVLKIRVLMFLVTEDEPQEYNVQSLAGIVSALEGERKPEMKCISVITEAVMISFGCSKRSFNRIVKGVEFVSYFLNFCHELFRDVIIADDDVIIIADNAIFLDGSIFDLWLIAIFRLTTVLSIARENKEPISTEKLQKVQAVLEFADNVKQLKMYQSIVERFKIDVKEWIKFELEMDDTKDLLPSYLKEEYYYTVINSYRGKERTKDDWSYSGVASAIVLNMLAENSVKKSHLPLGCQGGSHSKEQLTVESEEAKHQVKCKDTTETVSADSNEHFASRLSNSVLCLLRSLNRSNGLNERERKFVRNEKTWLFLAIDSWLESEVEKDKTEQSMFRNSQIHVLCCILDTLPPESLFGGNLMEPDSYDSVVDMFSLINRLSAVFLAGEFYLPCNLTARILTALTSMYYSIRSEDTAFKRRFSSNLQHVLSACRLFVISLIRHGNKPTIAEQLSIHIAKGLTCFQSIADMTTAMLKTEYKQAKSLFGCFITAAVCIYTNWHSKESTSREACFSTILSLDDEILLTFLECMIWDLVSCLVNGQHLLDNAVLASIRLVNRLIKKIPNRTTLLVYDILQGRTEHGLCDLRCSLVADQYAQLFPMVFIKLLAAMDPLFLRRFAAADKARKAVIDCINKCNNLMGKSKFIEKDMHVSPFDVAFVKELSMVEQILHVKR